MATLGQGISSSGSLSSSNVHCLAPVSPEFHGYIRLNNRLPLHFLLPLLLLLHLLVLLKVCNVLWMRQILELGILVMVPVDLISMPRNTYSVSARTWPTHFSQ